MANRTIGILGLGIFGQSVLKTLQDQDVDIIAIDDHADVINQYESGDYNWNCRRHYRNGPLGCGRYWELRHSRYRNR